MAQTRTQTTPRNSPTKMNPPFSNPPDVAAPKVRVGLDMNKEQKVVERLEQTLADTYAIYLKTQNAHWNVTGPLFKSLHDLFEEHYQELFAALDEIAERIRMLGSPVEASFTAFSERTKIDEWDQVPRADAMVRDLVEDHGTVMEALRALSEAADANGDEASVDLAARRLGAHEKHAWMLRVHLE